MTLTAQQVPAPHVPFDSVISVGQATFRPEFTSETLRQTFTVGLVSLGEATLPCVQTTHDASGETFFTLPGVSAAPTDDHGVERALTGRTCRSRLLPGQCEGDFAFLTVTPGAGLTFGSCSLNQDQSHSVLLDQNDSALHLAQLIGLLIN